jgi:hypothetical protein
MPTPSPIFAEVLNPGVSSGVVGELLKVGVPDVDAVADATAVVAEPSFKFRISDGPFVPEMVWMPTRTLGAKVPLM